MPSVNQSNGQVDPSKFGQFKNWKSSYTMESVLIALKAEMVANKQLKQPAEGAMY
jgi:ubiquitin-protein ligase